MAKCSTKGCNKGATKRVEIMRPDKSIKSRPICSSCSDKGINVDLPYRIVDAAAKHH